MPTEIQPLWKTAKACCELAYSQTAPARLLLWIGSTLAYEQIITSYAEAMAVAAELKSAYA